MGIAHFEQATSREFAVGHLRGRWSFLGEAAGSIGIGLRRIEVATGGWSTPVHDHGREEELFYVLSGSGLAWRNGATAAVGAGDCIVFHARRGGHSFHSLDSLDLLAFGPRHYVESPRFQRLGMSLLGGRAVDSAPGSLDGSPIQFVRESQVGPPELPDEPGQRPRNIVNLSDVEPRKVERPRIARTRRNLGEAVGSIATGLQHVEVVPGKLSAPLHCHSLEEELFVILGGDGVLLLDDKETPVRVGTVVSRPCATGVSHAFRAGPGGLSYLAYGTREPGDLCYYPTSKKINFGGVRVIARIEKLDYWDGED
jgi:uncharacterized cupin superfamily protein